MIQVLLQILRNPISFWGGVSVFERQAHWIETHMNQIAKRFDDDNPREVELHGSPMRTGRDGWDQHPLPDRISAIEDALRDCVSNRRNGVRCFAVAIKRGALCNGSDTVEYAFEQVSSRFDKFLMRCYNKHNDPQRGIIIFDKSTTEQRIQNLARDFKHEGHTYGYTRNYAEVPLFLDSKASRLIQLADLIAYSVYRFHANSDSQFYDIIKHRFDSEDGIQHGLHVVS